MEPILSSWYETIFIFILNPSYPYDMKPLLSSWYETTFIPMIWNHFSFWYENIFSQDIKPFFLWESELLELKKTSIWQMAWAGYVGKVVRVWSFDTILYVVFRSEEWCGGSVGSFDAVVHNYEHQNDIYIHGNVWSIFTYRCVPFIY